ncbi:MAG: hypothetical protein BWY84_01236 [Candidatus Aerophobetes bacterium ADurb.Bin490]|nr:MAG: hypothetical protein BWY84_01236 [Candidatus Aerophobetes bacterium ADurb.Bin490]
MNSVKETSLLHSNNAAHMKTVQKTAANGIIIWTAGFIYSSAFLLPASRKYRADKKTGTKYMDVNLEAKASPKNKPPEMYLPLIIR